MFVDLCLHEAEVLFTATIGARRSWELHSPMINFGLVTQLGENVRFKECVSGGQLMNNAKYGSAPLNSSVVENRDRASKANVRA